MENRNNQSGFTLIEMIFYVLFVTVIIGGTLGIVHQLLRNSENLKSGISIEEEGNFILKKLSWVLDDVDWDNPATVPQNYSTYLRVHKNDIGVVVVRIGADGRTLEIQRDGSGYRQISNDKFTISSLNFERGGDSSIPGSRLIRVSFEVDGKSFKLTRRER